MICKKISINGEKTYECITITLLDDYFDVVLNTSDCVSVINDLLDIQYIEIYDYENVLENKVMDYNGYSSISLDKETYTDEEGNPKSVVKVVFKKTKLDELIQELNRKVNNIVNEAAMTLDEYKQYKMVQLGEECRKVIEKGIDIETSLGKKHFTYKPDDQFNVKALFDSARMVKIDIPFHSSQNPCTVFTWQDAVNIYVQLESHLIYHTTYCNALFTMIREDLHTKPDIAKVTYGQEISENRKSEMNTALSAGNELMKAVLRECNLTAYDDITLVQQAK